MKTTLLLTTAIILTPLSALAAVQSISLADATEGIAPTINVCPGKGYNISFLDMPGGVAWAKIDDPSQVHVSFETRQISKSPAQLIHLQRIEQLNFRGIPKAPQTLLTVFTTSRQLLRFTVAYTCPNRFDTGIIRGVIATRRPKQRIKSKDPVIAVPKAKLSADPTEPQVSFSNQYVIEGSFENLYGFQPKEDSQTPSPELDPVPVPVPTIEVPAPKPKPTETAKAPVELSPSKVAWHLTKGLQQANLKGEINYNTYTYRRWQSIIARVRGEQDLPAAIKAVVPRRKLKTFQKTGVILLRYGGLEQPSMMFTDS
ncbi:hypothetical protein [Acaryochloris sp. IP29b_bin.148]|uniref:hypothetical protein n=1 Tax=Acaryochloris sp. IP29b_bin.148 TaxID=2969218 RepID=UPI00262628F3|nr:hypothetical protein [Acaryochloris sp. IP29b_bin.148]